MPQQLGVLSQPALVILQGVARLILDHRVEAAVLVRQLDRGDERGHALEHARQGRVGLAHRLRAIPDAMPDLMQRVVVPFQVGQLYRPAVLGRHQERPLGVVPQ